MAKILVVEDDLSTIQFMEPELLHEGFDVCTAMDGRSALTVFENENPDLVLLDIMLPVMDGLQVCKEIRKSSSVPIIMLTAKGETVDKVAGLDIGADDYMTKPFEVKELIHENVEKMKIERRMRIGEMSMDLDDDALELDEDMH